jgi:Tol biopolymer transport system component
MYKITSILRTELWLFCIVLGLTSLAACKGTFDIRVSVETQPPQSRLGKVAYITGGDLWMLDLDSEAHMRLTRDGYNSAPNWSASGQHLAFLKRSQLWVVDMYAQKATQLDNTLIDWFAWSPKDDRLAYFSESAGLLLYDADDQTVVSLLERSPGVTQENFIWSSDGQALFFNKGSIQEDRYAVSLEKISLDQPGTLSLFTSDDLSNLPHLALASPDGLWLAFWRWDTVTPSIEGQGLPVCMFSLQDYHSQCTDAQTLPFGGSIAWSSADNVAFVTEDPPVSNPSSLVILDIKTMTMQPLAAFADHSLRYPSWSPDGGQIAVSAIRENGNSSQTTLAGSRRIWVVDVHDGQQIPLTKDPRYSDDLPMWSVDGGEILFARLSEDEASLWMMQPDGSNLRQVVNELTPRPELFGAYSYINWQALWDWWRPES